VLSLIRLRFRHLGCYARVLSRGAPRLQHEVWEPSLIRPVSDIWVATQESSPRGAPRLQHIVWEPAKKLISIKYTRNLSLPNKLQTPLLLFRRDEDPALQLPRIGCKYEELFQPTTPYHSCLD